VSKPSSPAALTEETYLRAVSELGKRDSGLAQVVSRWGNPPFWTHAPGFPGIVIDILAQQVSLESAQAAFTKLEAAIGPVSPEGFLSLDVDKLRAIGFSRQKASYVRGVAQGITAGEIDFEALQSMADEEARTRLLHIRGVGAWTADAYLLFALRRPDVWPPGDLALVKAIGDLRELPAAPSSHAVDQIAGRWRPWRAVAARILWHYYLRVRGRTA
jgi:DNA-3-methyladenine glycosylase II